MPEKMVYLGELYLACSHVTSFPRGAEGAGDAEGRKRRLRQSVGLPQVSRELAMMEGGGGGGRAGGGEGWGEAE